MSLSLTKKQTKKDHACINPFKAAEKVCTSQGEKKKKKKTLEQKTVKAFSPRTYLASHIQLPLKTHQPTLKYSLKSCVFM